LESTKTSVNQFDAVVVGAGFSGMYMLHRLKEAGFSTTVIEAADGVGGVWYWNRYPGARCDSLSIYYNYTFSEELYRGWTWTKKYPEQPEILRYLNYVADSLNLRKDIQFETKVVSAHYLEERNIWLIETDKGDRIESKYFITGVGCISASNIPNFKGLESFKGEWYHTAHWPHKKVDYQGKKVGIIGTGSSGIQAIPVIAKEAEHLTVFQRTPQYSIPARNSPLEQDEIQQVKDNFLEIKKSMRESRAGSPREYKYESLQHATPEEREIVMEELWGKGGPDLVVASFGNVLMNEVTNDAVASFVRKKIHEMVKDNEIAKKLTPSYRIGTKRIVIDTDYFETYNRDNVTLVDVKKTPIQEITSNGVKTSEAVHDLDILIFATGFDGMTGPLLKMDIRGKGGVSLREKWDNGAQTRTYLGVSNAGFPNFFMITGPESPSVLGNVPVAIEQHVEWVADCIEYLRKHGIETIEAGVKAEEEWSKHCSEMAEKTLYMNSESWYNGANIEGKAKRFPIYVGGYGHYRKICDEIASQNYEGFTLTSTSNTVSNK